MLAQMRATNMGEMPLFAPDDCAEMAARVVIVLAPAALLREEEDEIMEDAVRVVVRGSSGNCAPSWP